MAVAMAVVVVLVVVVALGKRPLAEVEAKLKHLTQHMQLLANHAAEQREKHRA